MDAGEFGLSAQCALKSPEKSAIWEKFPLIFQVRPKSSSSYRSGALFVKIGKLIWFCWDWLNLTCFYIIFSILDHCVVLGQIYYSSSGWSPCLLTGCLALQCIYPVFKDLFCLSVNSNRTAKLVSD